MRVIDIPLALSCIDQSRARRRIKKSLRSSATLSTIAPDEWALLEMIALPAPNAKDGVLIIERDGVTYAISYELSARKSSTVGRTKPVICDFCFTWQPGHNASMITFPLGERTLNSMSFLCCADLKCSLHVRNLTNAAKISRAQLRENITDEQRIQRLHDKLRHVVDRLQLQPVNAEKHDEPLRMK